MIFIFIFLLTLLVVFRMKASDRIGHFIFCGIFEKFSKHEMYIFKCFMVGLKFRTQALL